VKKRKRLLLVIGGLLLVAYVASYVALSRRGYAEADRYNFVGFYYLAPEDSDRWRFWNYACVRLFWPLNVVDRGLGLGRDPAYEPLWGLSRPSPEQRLTGPAETEPPPLWHNLPAGPYAVGYQSGWQFDYSRRYNMTFDDKTTYAPGKAPRPLLVNRWYPASDVARARKMPHRDYLKIRSDDERLTRFSLELARYERDVISKEVMGKPAARLTGREKALLDEFFDAPTACVRDAAPARGAFPLVIYHAGAGSSYEDNSVLCEFLASHGFVVLGSAFQDQSGKSFNTDNREGSARDLEFLIAQAQRLPGVDWGRIGLVGHSAGAQASLVFRSQANSAVDAVVSLDTTQDYRGRRDPGWEFTSQVVKNGKNFTCPLLMVAGPDAFFEMADTLQGAERYYLTIKDMGHNDYISQGGVHNERMYQLHLKNPGQKAAERAREKAALEKARAGYRALCVYVLRFLEAKLKGDVAGKDFLAKQYRHTRPGDAEPWVEYVPAGRTGPDPYKQDSALPPTPRQLRPLLREQGGARTIALLRRFRKTAPTHPIFSQLFQLHVVSDLLDQGKTKDAIAFRDYYRETGLDCNKILLEIGKGYQRMGMTKWAAIFYKRVLLLDPSNREAAGGFKEVGGGKGIVPDS
jgi:dienelactone hydrolase